MRKVLMALTVVLGFVGVASAYITDTSMTQGASGWFACEYWHRDTYTASMTNSVSFDISSVGGPGLSVRAIATLVDTSTSPETIVWQSNGGNLSAAYGNGMGLYTFTVTPAAVLLSTYTHAYNAQDGDCEWRIDWEVEQNYVGRATYCVEFFE